MTHLVTGPWGNYSHFKAAELMADDFPTDVITLKGIKHFISSHGGERAFAGLSTTKVCDRFLKPSTINLGESYCGLAKTDPTRSGHIDQATAFVSHAWGHEFLDVIAALEDFDSRQPTRLSFGSTSSPTTSTRHPTASSAGGRPCSGTISGN